MRLHNSGSERYRFVKSGACGRARPPESLRLRRTLDAAMRVFWAKGYDGASLTELTDAVDINRPSLYGNKEDLLQLTLERCAGQNTKVFAECLSHHSAQGHLSFVAGGCESICGPRQPRRLLFRSGPDVLGDQQDTTPNEEDGGAASMRPSSEVLSARYRMATCLLAHPPQISLAIIQSHSKGWTCSPAGVPRKTSSIALSTWLCVDGPPRRRDNLALSSLTCGREFATSGSPRGRLSCCRGRGWGGRLADGHPLI